MDQSALDSPAFVGDPIPPQKLIDVVLEGPSSRVWTCNILIENKFKLIQLEEVEALLLAHEMRNEKFKKSSHVENTSINLTQSKNSGDPLSSGLDVSIQHASSQAPQSQDSNTSGFNLSGYSVPGHCRGGCGRFGNT